MTTVENRSWLPFAMNSEALDWPILSTEGARCDHPWTCPIGCTWHLIRGQGTEAYELGHASDGRLIHIRWWQDGVCRRIWARNPVDGTWPGTYRWDAWRP